MARFTVSLLSAGYMFVVFMGGKVRMSHYSRITRSVFPALLPHGCNFLQNLYRLVFGL